MGEREAREKGWKRGRVRGAGHQKQLKVGRTKHQSRTNVARCNAIGTPRPRSGCVAGSGVAAMLRPTSHAVPDEPCCACCAHTLASSLTASRAFSWEDTSSMAAFSCAILSARFCLVTCGEEGCRKGDRSVNQLGTKNAVPGQLQTVLSAVITVILGHDRQRGRTGYGGWQSRGQLGSATAAGSAAQPRHPCSHPVHCGQAASCPARQVVNSGGSGSTNTSRRR